MSFRYTYSALPSSISLIATILRKQTAQIDEKHR